MRRLAIALALLSLAACRSEPRPQPVKPLVVCKGRVPSDYAAGALDRAAWSWRYVRLTETTDCDVPVVWLRGDPVVHSGGGPGLAGMTSSGALLVAEEAWAGGLAGPLYGVLLHELGHALCLRHAPGVMAPVVADVSPFVTRRELDLAEAQRLSGCIGPHPEDR